MSSRLRTFWWILHFWIFESGRQEDTRLHHWCYGFWAFFSLLSVSNRYFLTASINTQVPAAIFSWIIKNNIELSTIFRTCLQSLKEPWHPFSILNSVKNTVSCFMRFLWSFVGFIIIWVCCLNHDLTPDCRRYSLTSHLTWKPRGQKGFLGMSPSLLCFDSSSGIFALVDQILYT